MDREPSRIGSLSARAVAAIGSRLELDDLRVAVCSIDDLVRMKRAAGRPKDMGKIPILLALEEESERA